MPQLNRDLLTGLLFIAIGGLGLWLGASLEAGTVGEMQAGYYPRLVCLLMVALGSLVALLGLLRQGELPERWHWWPLLMVAVAPLAFALLFDSAGFALTLAAVALLASLAGRMLNPWRMLVLAVVLVAMNIGLFVFVLGLPLRLWPRI
ncbi:tripartite tricarboxylate transporter TctB family protein [Siccirubricoccus phaeus]|uniref:tripartite tricarboxylate transporter TctB family protein n=1 Tax=Siccirubricoccus phaeus TaxID=2595053 RepID=UPI00165BFCD7|nr:tripartite tricarboxylate transporter TctB family protein [Siccirubricoccus phaeus]